MKHISPGGLTALAQAVKARRLRAGQPALPAREQTFFEDPEAGGITAEYAIAILTATGFAGLLLLILQSDTVRGWLFEIVEKAFSL
jgi:hypothetical protein